MREEGGEEGMEEGSEGKGGYLTILIVYTYMCICP